MKIADLPFRERPVRELLNLTADRDAPDEDYAGYGWARVPRLWLVETLAGERRRALDDVLVLALHTADDAPERTDDLQLELDLPDGAPVAVMASRFLATWLPRLPRAANLVLCVCNPHHARLPRTALEAAPRTWLPDGDVHSWRDRDRDEILLTAETWSSL